MPPPRNTSVITPTPEPLAGVVEVLCCPECASRLQVFGRQLGCARGHRFDIARQGYASLLTGAAHGVTGDSAAMLDARRVVQDTGLFAPVADILATACGHMTSVTADNSANTPNVDPIGAATATATKTADRDSHGDSAIAIDPGTSRPPADVNGSAPTHGTRWVLDAGAGTGYYAAHVLEKWQEARGVAVDVSKTAGRRCARRHPRLGSVVADLWRGLPVRDHSIDVVLSVFAPRNPAETRRVLRADGRFVLVTPTERHLGELVRARNLVRVDPNKSARLSAQLAGLFTVTEHRLVEYSATPPRAVVEGLIAMGPSARHGHGIGDLPDNFSVTVSVDITRCVPR